jgi:predicted outer membrane protein
MKCTSFCVLATTAAIVWVGAARAESDAEYANPGPSGASSLFGQRAGAAVKKPPVSSTMFAPAAAVNAKRMPVQQRDDRRFLKDAAAANRFEGEASRLALGKSNDPGVRSFAATLINHHVSASNELLHMLHARGMAQPMLANDQRKTLNRLAKLQGAKFDREFLDEVGRKFQLDDVQYFERASIATRDPQLKAWIDRTLPTLRYHLAQAERLSPDASKLVKGGISGYVSPASLATQSMGAGPAQLGMTQPPPAVKPIASSTP